MMTEQILSLLSQVVHPDSEDNIVSLGMVQVEVANEAQVTVSLRFARPRDPFASAIRQQCEQLLKQHFPQRDISVSLPVAEPKKSTAPAKKNAAPEPQKPAGVRHVVAVMSGKGGVGKSTVTANLAVTLAQRGYKVGLLDGDIYGPSIPKMFGVEDAKPLANAQEQMIPVEKFGVKLLSIGFFVKPQDALIWRGPMATGALRQLLMQADWGELDVLMLDMPPGTGDLHLTLLQEMKLSGVVVVSTPQQVALSAALKGISMLRHESMKVHILGLVENMAWFTPAELPQNRYYIFGREGCRQLARQLQLPLLGEIPLVQSICDSGDQGQPIALAPGAAREAFEAIAEGIISDLKI